MSRVRTYTFGPGSLESITVKLWRHPDKHSESLPHGGDMYRVRGSVQGTYRVYPGCGSDHTVEIAGALDFWTADIGRDSINGHAADLWYANNPKATEIAEALAHEVIDWKLEGWSDPCDSGE